MTRQSAGFAVGLAALVALAATTLAPAAFAQSSAPDDAGPDAGLPVASPGSVGMSADKLARIAPAMQAYVDDGRLAAVMTMVARRGQVVHWDAVGTRDTASGDALERDDIFRIYSMTKPVTSVATMILVEEGKVALDDPLSKFVPEFADVKVLAAGGERVAADGPITVEHLLTHTSGLSYGFFGDSAVDALYVESNPLAAAEGLDDFARRIAELPLVASPGHALELQRLDRHPGPHRRGGLRAAVRRLRQGAHSRSARDERHRVLGGRGQARPLHGELREGRRRAGHRRLPDGGRVHQPAELSRPAAAA